MGHLVFISVIITELTLMLPFATMLIVFGEYRSRSACTQERPDLTLHSPALPLVSVKGMQLSHLHSICSNSVEKWISY